MLLYIAEQHEDPSLQLEHTLADKSELGYGYCQGVLVHELNDDLDCHC